MLGLKKVILSTALATVRIWGMKTAPLFRGWTHQCGQMRTGSHLLAAAKRTNSDDHPSIEVIGRAEGL